MPSTVVLFTGGDRVSPSVAAHLPRDVFTIAADSGIEQAASLGYPVDLAVGDFDSVAADALAAVAAAGAVVERHPEAKDATDMELGLAAALERGAGHVVVVGGHGGRIDHFLANALLLASPAYSTLTIEAFIGSGRIVVARPGAAAHLDGRPGDLVSLLAVGGGASGVRTEGLVYALRGEPLTSGSTRGVSNVFAADIAAVDVGGGTVLVVQPHLRTPKENS